MYQSFVISLHHWNLENICEMLHAAAVLRWLESVLVLFQLDHAAFTLATPADKGNVLSKPFLQKKPKSSEATKLGRKETPEQKPPPPVAIHSSGEDLFRSSEKEDGGSLMGEESPSLADLSSNNTPELPQKTKKQSKKLPKERIKHRSKKVGGCGLFAGINETSHALCIFP